MVESHNAEQWPSGGSLDRGDDAARTQKLVEIVIGSATAIALGVGCFFLGKFLLGNQAVKPTPTTERAAAAEKAPASADREAAKTSQTPAADRAAVKTADLGAEAGKTGAPSAVTGTTGKTQVPPVAAATAEKTAAKPPAATAGIPKDGGKTSTTAAAKSATKTSATPVRGDALGQTPATKSAGGVRAEGVTLCASIKDRNPQGKASTFSLADGKIFCWMRIVGGQGTKVRCVWTMNGKKFEGVWLEIGSPAWRTWASKRLDKSMRGSCKVTIEAEGGATIGSASFAVQ